MKQTKFKEFFAMGGNHLCSADINDWLKGIPSASVVHWTAVPHGEYGCHVIVEYVEETAPKSKTKKNNDLNNVKKMTKQVEQELEDSLY